MIGCTKQNGDAARKGCIAVLLVWFDLPVLVLALLRLAAQLLRPPWLEFCGWIFGFLAHARLSEPSFSSLLSRLGEPSPELAGVYSRLNKRVPFAHARQKLGPFVHVRIVVNFFQFDQQLDDVRIVGVNLRRIQRAQQ